MAGVLVNNFKELLLLGDIDFINDAINVALLTSAYTPNIDTDTFFDDIDANEVVGTGYTAGGQALGSKTVNQDNTNDRGVFDAADVTWSSSSITARFWALYVDGATPGVDDFYIGYEDMGSDKTSSNGDFTIAWNASGILLLT